MSKNKKIKDDLNEFDKFDDISFDFDSFDEGGRTPTSKLGLAKDFGKGVGSSLGKAALEEARWKLPGGSALLRDLHGTYSSIETTLPAMATELREIGKGSKKLARAVLPRVRQLMPPKLYARLENATRSADEYARRSEKEEFEQGVGDMLKSTFDLQRTLAESSLIGQVETKIATKTQIGYLKGVHDQLVLSNQLELGPKRAFMRRSLEIQYRHLHVAYETRNSIKALVELSTAGFSKMVHNTSLPDIVKTAGRDNILTAAYNKGISSLASVGGNLTTHLKDTIIPTLATISDSLNMTVEMEEMLNDMGTSGFSTANMLGALVGGMVKTKLGKVAKRVIPKRAYRHIEASSNRMGDISKSMNHGGLGAINYLKSRGGVLGALHPLLGDPSDDVSFGNPMLNAPNKTAIFDNQTHGAITSVIPAYLRSIDKTLRDIGYGGNQEARIYDVVNHRLTTTTLAKDTLDTHIFGSETDRARGFSTAVGATLGSINKPTRLLGGKNLEEVIKQIVANAISMRTPLHSHLFVPYLNLKNDEQITDRLMIKLMNGVGDKIYAIRIIYNAITDPMGREKMEVTRIINAGIYDSISRVIDPDKMQLMVSGNYRSLYDADIDSAGTMSSARIASRLSSIDGMDYDQGIASGKNAVSENKDYRLAKARDIAIVNSRLAEARDRAQKEALRIPMLGKLYGEHIGSQFHPGMLSGKTPKKKRSFIEAIRKKLSDGDGADKAKQLQVTFGDMGEEITYSEARNLIDQSKVITLENALVTEKLSTIGSSEMVEQQVATNKHMGGMQEFLKATLTELPSFMKFNIKAGELLYKATVEMPSKLIEFILKQPLKLFSPLVTLFKSLFGKRDKEAIKQRILTEKHQTAVEGKLSLIAKLLKRSPVAGDEDGDGHRDGSWKEQFAKRSPSILYSKYGVRLSEGSKESSAKKSTDKKELWMAELGDKIKLIAGLAVGAVAAFFGIRKGTVGLARLLGNNDKGMDTPHEFKQVVKAYKKESKKALSEYGITDDALIGQHAYLMAKGDVSGAQTLLEKDQKFQGGKHIGGLKGAYRAFKLNRKEYFDKRKYNFTEEESLQLDKMVGLRNSTLYETTKKAILDKRKLDKGLSRNLHSQPTTKDYLSKLTTRAKVLKDWFLMNEEQLTEYWKMWKISPDAALTYIELHRNRLLNEDNRNKEVKGYDPKYKHVVEATSAEGSKLLAIFSPARLNKLAKYVKEMHLFGATLKQEKRAEGLLKENRIYELQWYLDDILWRVHSKLGLEKVKGGGMYETLSEAAFRTNKSTMFGQPVVPLHVKESLLPKMSKGNMSTMGMPNLFISKIHKVRRTDFNSEFYDKYGPQNRPILPNSQGFTIESLNNISPTKKPSMFKGLGDTISKGYSTIKAQYHKVNPTPQPFVGPPEKGEAVTNRIVQSLENMTTQIREAVTKSSEKPTPDINQNIAELISAFGQAIETLPILIATANKEVLSEISAVKALQIPVLQRSTQ